MLVSITLNYTVHEFVRQCGKKNVAQHNTKAQTLTEPCGHHWLIRKEQVKS